VKCEDALLSEYYETIGKDRRKKSKSVKKKIIGGIKKNVKGGEFKKKTSITGTVLSFNIAGMKA